MTRPSFRGGMRCPTCTVDVDVTIVVGIVWDVVADVLGGLTPFPGDNEEVETAVCCAHSEFA